MTSFPDDQRSSGDADGVPLERYIPELATERMRRARARIRTGFYDRRETLLTTAERILEAGDVPD